MRSLPLAMILVLAVTGAARAGLARVDYAGYLGGVEVLSLALNLDARDDRYRVQLTGETVGMIAWMAKVASWNEVQGAFGLDGVRPHQYAALTTLNGRRRSADMAYGPDRLPRVTLDPPPEKDARDGVPDEYRRATLDALSAGLELGRILAATGKCDATLPVFDGRRRYDVIAEDGGATTLARTDYSVFSGPAHLCTVRVRRLKGFQTTAPEYDAPEDRLRRFELFFAPVFEHVPPLVVMMRGETKLGAVRLHPTALSREATFAPPPG